MAWVERGGRAYEYRSIRRGRRVTSVYAGGGISAESGAFIRALDAARRAERAAERVAERVAWEAERDQLRAAERWTIEVDEAYGAVAEAALYATGHHRPQRGRWRKRRPMTSQIEATKSDEPLVSASEMGDLLDRIDRSSGDAKKELQEHAHRGVELLLKWARAGDIRALPALRVLMARRPDYLGRLGALDFAIKAHALAAAGTSDVLLREVFSKEIQATADQLAGPDASPLERLMCMRVSLANHDSLNRDVEAIEAELNGRSPERVEFLTRLRDRATGRFLASCKALATVRRLALPTLQVHLNDPAAGIPDRADGPADVPLPRLRLGGHP